METGANMLRISSLVVVVILNSIYVYAKFTGNQKLALGILPIALIVAIVATVIALIGWIRMKRG